MIGKALRRPVLGVLLWGMAWAAQAAPTASASANPAFDRSATAAKAAMVTEPGRALVASQAALAAAAKTPPGRDRDLETATADWLMGEALTRTKHPERALPILDAALGIVVKAAPGGKRDCCPSSATRKAKASTSKPRSASLRVTRTTATTGSTRRPNLA